MARSRSPRRSKPVDGRENYLFVGNPGTGKSTIINGIVGEPVFHSALSLTGKGVTFNLDTKDVSGWGRLMDTPGLADDALKEQAAKCITTALRQDGYYRIFFVLTEESGRVRPADKATMKLVLDAAPITNYGVIINKAKKGWLKKLHAQAGGHTEWFTTLLTGLPVQTSSVFFNTFDDTLDCEDNVKYNVHEALRNFIRTAPGMHIKKEDVRTVEADAMKAITKQMEDRIQAFEKDAKVKAEMLEKAQKEMIDANRRAKENAKAYEQKQKDLLKQIEETRTSSAAEKQEALKQAEEVKSKLKAFEEAQRQMAEQAANNEKAMKEAVAREQKALRDKQASDAQQSRLAKQLEDKANEWTVGRTLFAIGTLGMSELFG